MNLKRKITAGIVTVSLLATVLPAAAFADTTVRVRNNGKKSINNVRVTNTSTVNQTQRNRSFIATGVLSVVGTGGNTITSNTGAGDSSIDTGNGTSTVSVSVGGSSNVGTGQQCPCDLGNVDVTVADNGKKSDNTVTVTNTSTSTVTQSNSSAVITLVGSVVGTGGNTIEDNTGAGDKSIDTGTGTSTVSVSVTGSQNNM